VVNAVVTPESYKIEKFWDSNINYIHQYQISLNSCGPACVQMVLDFFNVDPLPSQEELAKEMNSTLCEYTYAWNVHKAFQKRNIEVEFDGHLNNTDSLENLKGNVSLNRPAIVLMWYDGSNITGHYRVVTGYNETGFFLHDPAAPGNTYSGPNIYFDNVTFVKLWTKYDEWLLILESGEKYISLDDHFHLQLIVIGLILAILVILVIVIFHPKTKTTARNLLSMLSPSLLILVWFLFDHFYVKNLFSTMVASEVVDLSKTMIQTLGILVSFGAIAAFFHLGKIEELASSYFLRIFDYVKSLGACKDELEEAVRKAEELGGKWPRICQTCTSSEDCELRHKLPKTLKKHIKSVKKSEKTINGVFGEAKKLPEEIQRTITTGSTWLMRSWVFAIGSFLTSILLCIVAYLSKDDSFLSFSMTFVVVGIVIIMMASLISYSFLQQIRDSFLNIISATGHVDMTISDIRDYCNYIDETLEKQCKKEETSTGI